MKKLKIGIIKEGKRPVDHRVALTPQHCKKIRQDYPQIEIAVQPSEIRCYTDEEYAQEGITLQEDLADCDILFGVKEVQVADLIPNKKYLFFSHTIKKQEYNRTLLQNVVTKNIQLIDYECLKNETGRVVAFGRWAGIVGAYNAFLSYGKKYNKYELKPANKCHDMIEMLQELNKVSLPPIKIVVTGGGRVAKGAMEILTALKIRQVTKHDFFNEIYDRPVYIQLETEDYTVNEDGSEIYLPAFYENPDNDAYQSSFGPYAEACDIFIAAAYWDPKAPKLFTKEEAQSDSFKIRVIADITCDIDGSVPTTIKSTTIDNPVFDLDLSSWTERPAYSDINNVSIMAVDNLPCELPRDASISFGDQLLANVCPQLFGEEDILIDQASITKNGDLNAPFEYLRDYLEGKQ